MNVNFTKSILLLLIPLVLFIIWFIPRKSPDSFRKRFLCVLRSVICILLILSMAGMSIRSYTDITTTIFAADMSKSTSWTADSIESFIKEGIAQKTDKDHVGIIAFGNTTAVEIGPAKEIQFSQFQSYVNNEGTNIENALKMAQAIIEESTAKRIVLLSDGLETAGNALQAAQGLSAAGLIIDGVYIESNLKEEVQITSLSTPSVIDKNVEYEVELVIYALTENTANIKVYKGSELIVNRDTGLRSGENRFVFSDISDLGGGVIYRAEISSPADTMPENNKAYAYTYIDDVPAVLIVENETGSGREFSKILEGSGVRVQTVSQSGVPLSIEQLNLWDCVVLADVSAEDLSEDFMNTLDVFVKTTGGGLITLGGANSYALGGYQESPLKDILPVSMDLETDGEKPDLAMVMVIDRSGSMTDASYGISRMEMAKEAAIRGVDAMEEDDSVGVLAFDTENIWVVEMQKIGGNTQSIQSRIAQIQPGGGTSILPALDEAYSVLRDTDAKLKHIILLTDGQAERNGYDPLIAAMNENGVTLSTIAIGNGADTQLLNMLAQQGGGRYYYTDEFTDLPRIFTKETTLAGKEYLNNRNFYPRGKDYSPIVSGVASVPMLNGYVSVTAKPRADVILISDEDDPILAAWQYGIGRSVSWMSDADGQWTGDWLGSSEGVAIFRNMVSWAIRGGVSESVVFSGTSNGVTGTVKAEMPFDSDVEQVFATLVSADNVETRKEMVSTAPGVYTMEVDGLEEGGYIVSLSLESKENTEVVRGGFVIGYPAEYDISSYVNGLEFMERLTALSGGKMLTSPEEVFTSTQTTALKNRDLAPGLMVAALLLFLFEIAARRMTVIISRIERFFKRFKRGNKEQKATEEKPIKRSAESKKETPKTTVPEKSEISKPQDIPEKTSTSQALLRNKQNRK